MTYVFDGSPRDVVGGFFQHVKNAARGGVNADRELALALVCLVGLEDRQAQMAPLDPAHIAEFRQDSAASLADFEHNITEYIYGTIFLAEGANEDEWYELCVRRSVIQILAEEYTGTQIAGLVDPTDVGDLDVEMRRVGTEQGPIPEQFIPKGLPESHWWWHFPTVTDGTAQ
jgi:hypothetical protein